MTLPNRTAARLIRLSRETGSALRGLIQGSSPGVPEGAAALALELIGDTLRLEEHLPDAVRAWLRTVTPALLAGATANGVNTLVSIALPGTGSPASTELLTDLVLARDRAESLRVGILRAVLAAGIAPADVAGFGTFEDAIGTLDTAMDGHLDPIEAEELLGDRAVLGGPRGWTSRLRFGLAASPTREALPKLETKADVRPDDAAITAYVGEGRHAGWVETFAKAHPEFADELLGHMEALRDLGEPVSLVARRWRNIGAVPMPVQHAAARAGATERAIKLPLGMLAPLDAIAVLAATATHTELRVLAEPGSLTRVALGDSAADGETDPGVWVVRIPGPGDYTLSVRARDGRAFEHPIGLEWEHE